MEGAIQGLWGCECIGRGMGEDGAQEETQRNLGTEQW